MQKKVAIITWHNYPNFGSALQAYALHTYINKKNGNATIINYINGTKPSLYSIRLVLSLFDRFIPNFISKKIHYRFISFEHKYFKETKEINSRVELEKLSEQFDCFICGSDQIWAPNVFNDIYMLSFVPEHKEKYSYAASIGLPHIPASLKQTYATLLRRFNLISVREKQAKDLLKNDFNIDSQLVLDPTLLLSSLEWNEIIKKSPIKSESYILCYFLGTNQTHREIAKELAHKLNCKAIILSRYNSDRFFDFTIDSDAGPKEFLRYIRDAKLIITDSFHGLCFSINFNKDFYVVNRFTESDPINQNSRIKNILEILNLENRLIDATPQTISSINYTAANKKLEEMRTISYNFISEILNN